MTTPVPANPKIYHITHVDNLENIVHDGYLHADSTRAQRQGDIVIGMDNIKIRRLSLPVSCCPDTMVGNYVPFYFCPRSIMLYVIHCANHPDLAYRGGQGPIIHLEVDLHSVVRWAEEKQRLWAYSLSNAGSYYAQFYTDLDHLDEIDWNAVAARDWSEQDIREAKQAECLVQQSFPWCLVERIGVYSQDIAYKVFSAMSDAKHRPRVEITKSWYY